MTVKDFLLPVSNHIIDDDSDFQNTQLASCMRIFKTDFPDLDNDYFDIAIIGVPEDRSSVNNFGCADGADEIRKQLYSLHQGTQNVKIVDLGNLKQGKTVSDTYFALKMVVSELLTKNIVPVIIGGSQDVSYAQYQAYEKTENKIDVVTIDAKFDLDVKELETSTIHSNSFLNAILLHTPNYLFNLSNIGYQTYYISQESLKAMEQLFFDAYRLGEITSNLQSIEPLLRSADMISFDIGAIRSSDAGANANPNPNGFFGHEACQICRYAGMSDKLSSIGFYEYNPKLDPHKQTAMLMAQMLWYFIEGVGARKNDFPSLNSSEYVIYRCAMKEHEYELIFVKSSKSDRWWMQVPYSTASNNERYHWMPCSYEDYIIASEGDMPSLWWKTHQKLS